MEAHAESITERLRVLLGQARLVFWDDEAISDALKQLHDRLQGPLGVGVVGGADEDRSRFVAAVEAAGGTRLVVVEPEAADAWVVLLGGPGDVAAPDPLPVWASVGVVPPDPEQDGLAAAQSATVRAIVRADAASAEECDALTDAVKGLVGDGEALRAAAALRRFQVLHLDGRRRGSEAIAAVVEELALSASLPQELAAATLLAREDAPGLDPETRADGLAILRARLSGTERAARPDATRLASSLSRWRAHASDPTLPSPTRAVAATVGRACERLLALVASDVDGASAGG